MPPPPPQPPARPAQGHLKVYNDLKKQNYPGHVLGSLSDEQWRALRKLLDGKDGVGEKDRETILAYIAAAETTVEDLKKRVKEEKEKRQKAEEKLHYSLKPFDAAKHRISELEDMLDSLQLQLSSRPDAGTIVQSHHDLGLGNSSHGSQKRSVSGGSGSKRPRVRTASGSGKKSDAPAVSGVSEERLVVRYGFEFEDDKENRD